MSLVLRLLVPEAKSSLSTRATESPAGQMKHHIPSLFFKGVYIYVSTSCCRIQGHTTPSNSTPDNQDVELITSLQCLELFSPVYIITQLPW